jgi:dihydrofolate reductase
MRKLIVDESVSLDGVVRRPARPTRTRRATSGMAPGTFPTCEDGGDLQVIGSAQLVKALIQLQLVDELRLMIDPVLLGGGKRVFDDDGELRPPAAGTR